MLLVLALVAFRDVLLPFVLAVVVAYVLSPVVNAGEQLRFGGRAIAALGRGAGRCTLTLVGALAGLLVVLGAAARGRARAPEQGGAAGGRDRAQAVAARARPPRAGGHGAVPAIAPRAGQRAGAGAPERGADGRRPTSRTAIELRARPDGGYRVVLPPGGMRVVAGGRPLVPHRGRRPTATSAGVDLSAAITKAAARAMENTERHGGQAAAGGAEPDRRSSSRGVMTFVLMLVLSAYMLITTRPHLRVRALARMRPAGAASSTSSIRRIDRGLSGVVRGQLIICCVNGALSGIGFYMLGLKYWAFLTRRRDACCRSSRSSARS